MIDFDPAQIEQMDVNFEPCPACGGDGIVDNGIIYWECSMCFGTGEVEAKNND